MNVINCAFCGKPTEKKRSSKKFCSNACRTRNNRKQKGIPEPSFLQKTSSSINRTPRRQPRVEILKPVRSNNHQWNIKQTLQRNNISAISTTERERIYLMNARQYWSGVYQNADKDIVPAFTIIGAGIGFGTNEENKFISALFGGLIGNAIDSQVKENRRMNAAQVKAKALQQVRYIDVKLKDLSTTDKELKRLAQMHVLEPEQPETGKMRVVSSSKYKSAVIPSLGVTGEYLYLIGDPTPGFFMLVSGMPGNGKTTFAVKLAEYLQKNHGKVLYMPYEQKGLNKPLQSLLNEFNTTFDINAKPNRTLIGNADLVGYDFLVIDSINHAGITAVDVEAFRENHPNVSIIGIMQNTKDGKFRGDNKFLHDADIHVKLDSGHAYQTKSRFAKGESSIKVWQD